ncbi:MAG: hypothetical protein JWO91_2134 [Acidobacteriaceae bacterium]|nr:hypothetical protein [Acidobacteriaceae bacterium]
MANGEDALQKAQEHLPASNFSENSLDRSFTGLALHIAHQSSGGLYDTNLDAETCARERFFLAEEAVCFANLLFQNALLPVLRLAGGSFCFHDLGVRSEISKNF